MTRAETLLRALLRTIARENNFQDYEVTVKTVNSGGANYTSALFRAIISEKDKDDLNLFAKVAIVGDKMRELMNATKMFNNEGFFYLELMKTYEDIQDKHGIMGDQRLMIPKFYGINPNEYEETLVLENLDAKGFACHDRFKSLDWDHASSAVEVLAKFHALSFAYQKEKPEEFKKVTEYLWWSRPTQDESVTEGFFPQMVKRALDLVSEERQARVMKLMEDGGVEMYEKYNRPFGNPVLIHGDYRPSNLLFKRKGDRIQTIPVDFQTVHTGAVVTDLVYFIFVGTDSEFRAEHYERLIEHYYEQLRLAMKRLEVDTSEVYPRSEFDRELKEVLPYAVLLGISLLPVVLVEEENAPRVDGDSDISSFVIAPTDLFAERFRGIVEDCVRLGAI